jgi:hypothetical protein
LTAKEALAAGGPDHSGSIGMRARDLEPLILLMLQLAARGYSREQIALLMNRPAAVVERAEVDACAALGVATLAEAIAIALEQELIV